MVTPVKANVPSTENPESRPAASEPKPAEWIIPLARASGRERALVGGKAANLGRMLQAGLPVPEGFCVTTAAFRLWIEGNSEASALLDHLESRAKSIPAGVSWTRNGCASSSEAARLNPRLTTGSSGNSAIRDSGRGNGRDRCVRGHAKRARASDENRFRAEAAIKGFSEPGAHGPACLVAGAGVGGATAIDPAVGTADFRRPGRSLAQDPVRRRVGCPSSCPDAPGGVVRGAHERPRRVDGRGGSGREHWGLLPGAKVAWRQGSSWTSAAS